ncbi:chitin deacetylase [Stygiomarasmius scandens]|uniref:chitin deacetylase n=1 Tax=Marasmiellus scandens TaxID=2682957 RepID=A0ABR1JWD4_9AGAR
MKLLVLASLSVLVAAHDELNARQAPPSSSAPPSAPVSSASVSGSAAPSGASSAPVSGVSGTASVSAPTPSGLTTLTFTPSSTNPTAFPLQSITASQSSPATIPLPSTPAAGETPSISGAPTLPDLSPIQSASYPPWDMKPPIDSPQVQQWKQEVADSNVPIPDIPPTVAGGCPANPQAATNSSICWWTCGGCTRDTDISDCPEKLSWGLTYDDGPSFYTPNLLDYLDQASLKATFFAVGSRCVQFPHTLQLEYMKGHQIGVHTWSHPPLTTLTNDEIIAELGWTKQIIKDVLGVTPNMMRPPFGDIDDRVRAISIAMGLTPVMWSRMSTTATFDTDDFNVHGGLTTSEQVLNNWEAIMGNASTKDDGFIVLEHDLFVETVELATGYILPQALAHQPPFNIQPVVQCLNKPMTDAYIETNDNSTNPPAASGAVTLSAGAPGSAQATGTDSGAAVSITSSVSGTLVAGVLLSLAVFQF